VSELIKRILYLRGVPVAELDVHYERPTQ